MVQSSGESLREWLAARNETLSSFARRAGINVGTLNHLMAGRRNATEVQELAIAEATGGAIQTWTRAVPLRLVSPDPEVAPPAAAPSSPPREIGSTAEELRLSLVNLARASEAPGTTPAQRAQLEGRKLAVIRELQRLQGAGGIEEHPDFEGLIEDMVQAVLDVLGPAAPPGVEERIADRLERLQAARQRRAS